MKVTDKLKKKSDKVSSVEGVKTNKDINKAGTVLEEAELDQVTGGEGAYFKPYDDGKVRR